MRLSDCLQENVAVSHTVKYIGLKVHYSACEKAPSREILITSTQNLLSVAYSQESIFRTAQLGMYPPPHDHFLTFVECY